MVNLGRVRAPCAEDDVPTLLDPAPFYKQFIKIMNENIDICERHLSKAVANLTEDSETVIAKLYAACGKDSAIPLIMAMDSITAGIDTTGLNIYLYFI